MAVRAPSAGESRHANIGHIEVEAGRPEPAVLSSKAAVVLAVRVGSSVQTAWMLSEIAIERALES